VATISALIIKQRKSWGEHCEKALQIHFDNSKKQIILMVSSGAFGLSDSSFFRFSKENYDSYRKSSA
jgi:hypothetical protein